MFPLCSLSLPVFVVLPRVSPTRYKVLHCHTTVTILFIAVQPSLTVGLISNSKSQLPPKFPVFQCSNVKTLNIQISMFAKFTNNWRLWRAKNCLFYHDGRPHVTLGVRTYSTPSLSAPASALMWSARFMAGWGSAAQWWWFEDLGSDYLLSCFCSQTLSLSLLSRREQNTPRDRRKVEKPERSGEICQV